MSLLAVIILLGVFVFPSIRAHAEILNTSNVQISWKVTNRFRFFAQEDVFKQQELAWAQYGQHMRQAGGGGLDEDLTTYDSSVLGIEHMLNDRRIPFTKILRTKFDWRGWAAGAVDKTCYDRETRQHSACGGVDNYISPSAHEIEVKLLPRDGGALISEYICNWQIGEEQMQAPCDQTITAQLPYPSGATISVNAEGERPISIDARVRDLLIVGFGDSFASGEGNPDIPAQFDGAKRKDGLYPLATSRSQWLDRLCHRSLYSYQMRAALQIGIEDPHSSVTYLGYACSGAQVEKGILGGQTYVEARSTDNGAQYIKGGAKDGQFYRFLAELCREAPLKTDGLWRCPNNDFKRNVDHVFLSIGGNDIGFANLVSWATLRTGPLANVANFLGATISPTEFSGNMDGKLDAAYQRLAQQFEASLPLPAGALSYDPSRVTLTAYPDILVDEKGLPCQGSHDETEFEDIYPANQSMDRMRNWLVLRQDRLDEAHSQLQKLHKRMGALADALGWSYAGKAYSGAPFKGHGFCARNYAARDEPTEVLMIPCFGDADRATQSCAPNILKRGSRWRPYDPAAENFSYALRQRWVRTINDAYMVLNQKVRDAQGRADEKASAQSFSETTGAMHPSAEGQASLADAMLLDLRPRLQDESN